MGNKIINKRFALDLGDSFCVLHYFVTFHYLHIVTAEIPKHKAITYRLGLNQCILVFPPSALPTELLYDLRLRAVLTITASENFFDPISYDPAFTIMVIIQVSYG